jgi:hypothetical protein
MALNTSPLARGNSTFTDVGSCSVLRSNASHLVEGPG